MTASSKPAALQFKPEDRVGRVKAVDTSRVLIEVEDPSLITRVGIGNLIAVRGATEREFLIGMTERVTRSLRDAMLDDDDGDTAELPLTPHPEDIIRVVLVGTYRTVDGEKPNVFKRGADSFPQI